MEKVNKFMILLSLILLSSCNPLITTKLEKDLSSSPNDEQIKVFGLNDEIPIDAEVLGTAKIGDAGFTLTQKCGFNDVLEAVKLEAQKAGGNAIKITQHIPPGASTCHRITAKILRTNNIRPHLINEQIGTVSQDYAILKIYSDSCAKVLNYDLHLGEAVICKVKNNIKAVIAIKEDGVNTIWAKTGERSEIQIDIKYGQTYYLRCNISKGDGVEHPTIEMVDSQIGSQVFDLF